MSKADMKFLAILLIDSIYLSVVVTYVAFLRSVTTLNYLQTFFVTLSLLVMAILGLTLCLLTEASIPGGDD